MRCCQKAFLRLHETCWKEKSCIGFPFLPLVLHQTLPCFDFRLTCRKTEVERKKWTFFADLHLLLIECGLDLRMQTNLQQENAPVPIAKPKPAWFPWRSGWGHSPCLAAIWIPHSYVSWGREGATNRVIFIRKRKWTSRIMISCHTSCRTQLLKINKVKNTVNLSSSGNFFVCFKEWLFLS